jgi:8-oxo-dGTP pyrophosphatase MutT (NUDIX family)
MKLRVVIIILYDLSKKFLLQHRSSDAKLMPDYWAFFGGEINERETPEQAVRRETYEELNYRLRSPHLVKEQEFKEGSADGYMYVFIEYFDADKINLKLQEGQGWGWFTKAEMNQLKMIHRDREIITSIVNYLEEK